MDPGQRRRTTPRAARLILRGAIVLGLLLLLARLVAGPAADGPERFVPTRVLGAEPASAAPTTAAAPAASAASGAPAPAAPAAQRNRVDDALTATIRRLIRGSIEKARRDMPSRLTGAEVSVGVHVRERGVPGDLVALDADRAMRPASNMKLVTSAAALVLLGPGWRFETPFEIRGPIRDGRLEGPLVVRAAGDPFYAADAVPGAVPRGFLEPVVSALEAEGVRVVEGGIVLDEGTFLTPGPGPAWPSSNQFDQEYCALAGGFSVSAGCMTAIVRPGRPGQPGRVELAPAGHGLREAVDVETVAARKPLVVHVQARSGRATVRGRIPVDVPEWSTRFAHEDPVELFGHVLRARLAAASIAVEGPLVRERGARGGREIARVATSLAATLKPINTDSNNSVADQVFFAMGDAVAGSGTRAGGLAATTLALERLGVPTAGLVQVDGSGLSRDNRVTARQITALVDGVLALDAATATAFEESLAVAGQTGTLEGRMDDLEGRVRAKTGFIGGTSALSGTLTTRDGRTLVFSILVEYPVAAGLNSAIWKPLQNEICNALVGADG